MKSVVPSRVVSSPEAMAVGRAARQQRRRQAPDSTLDLLDATHRRLALLLTELDGLPALAARDAAAAETLAAEACAFFAGTAREHHEVEETKVFPSLLKEAGAPGRATLREHVTRLQQDHLWLEEDWLELEPHLQAVAQGWRGEHVTFLAAALPEFTTLYRAHLVLEETVVYPEARRVQQAAVA